MGGVYGRCLPASGLTVAYGKAGSNRFKATRLLGAWLFLGVNVVSENQNLHSRENLWRMRSSGLGQMRCLSHYIFLVSFRVTLDWKVPVPNGHASCWSVLHLGLGFRDAKSCCHAFEQGVSCGS